MKNKIDLKVRLQSNEIEGNVDFMPSIKLWDSIEDSLESNATAEKPSNKNRFWFFFFSISVASVLILYPILTSTLTLSKVAGDLSNVLLKQNHKVDNHAENYDQALIEPTLVTEPEYDESIKDITYGDYVIKDESLQTSDVYLENPATLTENNNSSMFYSTSTIDPVDERVFYTNLADAVKSNYNNTINTKDLLTDREDFYLGLHSDRSNKGQYIDDKFSEPDKRHESYNSLGSGPTANAPVSKTSKENNSLFIRPLPRVELKKFPIDNLLSNLIAEPPSMVVLKHDQLSGNSFVGVKSFAQSTIFNIINLDNNGGVEYDLQGLPSAGVELFYQKEIGIRFAFRIGLNITRLRYVNRYSMDLDVKDAFSFELPNGESNLSFTKIVPSLNGDLKNIISLSVSQLNQDKFSMSYDLVNNFTFIEIPMMVSYLIITEGRHRLSAEGGVSVGRIITTGTSALESSQFSDSTIKLRNVDISRIANKDSGVYRNLLELPFALNYQYRIGSRLALGGSIAIQTSLVNLYTDASHRISTSSFRSGITLSYQL